MSKAVPETELLALLMHSAGGLTGDASLLRTAET